jgi:hypothetical protein
MGDPLIKRGRVDGHINWFNTAKWFVCLKAGPNLLLTNDVITYVSNDVNMSLFVVLLILVELLTFTVYVFIDT